MTRTTVTLSALLAALLAALVAAVALLAAVSVATLLSDPGGSPGGSVLSQERFPCQEDEVLGYAPRFGPERVGCIHAEGTELEP